MNYIFLCLTFLCFSLCNSYRRYSQCKKLCDVFAWKQINYDFDEILYDKDTDYEKNSDHIHFVQHLNESEKFFIQYNNVPIGFEVYENRVFITVPRRRHGIPSTLNYVDINSPLTPRLKPYPNVRRRRELISVYRPRVDVCGRLWVVDTGLLEVPGERRQLKQPAIIIYDLNTDKKLLEYELKSSDLIDERSPAGLTSITIDVDHKSCDDAYAYINDLATNGLIVFSLKQNDSWRLQHGSFEHNPSAMNFTVAGHIINWKDGLFSIALSDKDQEGNREAYYHPLVSTNEYSINTHILKNKLDIGNHSKNLGSRGPLSQSGSHSYHAGTRTMFFANVAQDAILCWNIDTKMDPENVPIVIQDHQKLVYISDLKVIADEVWVLVNQIPRFVYSRLNTNEFNYYIHRSSVQNLIRGTACQQSKKEK